MILHKKKETFQVHLCSGPYQRTSC